MNRLLEKFFIFLLLGALLGLFFSIYWNTEITDHEEDWLKTQKDRKDSLHSICQNKNFSSSEKKLDEYVARQLFVDENYKFIYCEVPKVGCSIWKKIVLLLTLNLSRDVFEVNQDEIHKTNLLKRLSSYPSKQQQELLNSFTKVMITRHPLERLVSAYRDKFLHLEPYYSITVANEIKALFRKNKNLTGNVTFQEFVNFVVTRDTKHLDIHWKPMFQLCDPCNIHYDILGKYETLDQDVSHVLSRIKAPQRVRYPNSKLYTERTNKDITTQYLKKLNWDQIQKITDVYQMDFSLFNYSFTVRMEMSF
ncbi:carbohydrate sulfotransferase 9-like [Python bivittatus]|uniref:Carbohydrate sulfotransferase n=1 Tax=Python bivittatus TaxID=176946 RepID=A0A9F2R1N8_PYTBI|nr:carbohydrate sulfotransferase 9-like [Python bivittatus]XP_025025931.1 carbohydrate sulfotransferase 9-like [Python bivittatus]XP_025025932.1 carbohydrate sulfotransferase 9-like [Python bivittatus]XP_025025933.1 carbohydrate sulfotransferase 9-like [Python bivittatus]